MPITVDASVALKWVIEEPDSDAARKLLAEDVLVAPDLLYIECANSLWRKVRRAQLDRDEARAAYAAIEAAPISVSSSMSSAAKAPPDLASHSGCWNGWVWTFRRHGLATTPAMREASDGGAGAYHRRRQTERLVR